MENNDFLLRVQSSYNQFTQAEKKVADFILRNKKDVLYMSISDLAAACEVGDTSVFRFCKKMKLRGYPDFRLALSLSINKTENTGGKVIEGELEPADSFGLRSQKIMQNNINALNETYSLLNKLDFAKTIDYFEQAEKVFFFGVGASMLASMFAMNKFLRITTKVLSVSDFRMQTMLSSMLTEDCLAVVVSYSGATKESVQFAKLAKGAGAKVVCITKYEKSALTNYADVVLLCGVNEEGTLLGGSTSSYMSRLYLIELIYLEYYYRQRLSSELNRQKSSNAMGEEFSK